MTFFEVYLISLDWDLEATKGAFLLLVVIMFTTGVIGILNTLFRGKKDD